MKTSARAVARFAATLALSLGAAAAMADDCGGPLERNNFGRPVDYTNSLSEARNIEIVERYHFNQRVEALLEGMTGPLPTDIDYTLRQIPNHYRALNAMAKWQLKNPRPPTASYFTAECYFVRALAFRPDDGNLHMIFAVYQHQKKDYDAALGSYKRAEQLGLDSPELFYNMGLLYFDRREYADSRAYAAKAYGAGYPLRGLRRKLQAVNEWREPAAAAAPSGGQP